MLKNSDRPPRFDTGLTSDLGARVEAHNAGRCTYTAKHRPWAVDVVVKSADLTRAVKFESISSRDRALSSPAGTYGKCGLEDALR